MVHRQLYFAVGLILLAQISARAQDSAKELNIRYSALKVTSEESQDVEELIDFENILPLEIQILRRELELGMDVKERLAAKEKAFRDRDVSAIPPELLPLK